MWLAVPTCVMLKADKLRSTTMFDSMQSDSSAQVFAQLRKLRRRKFTRTRVPSTDALVAFLPNSGSVSSEIRERKDSASEMRLYPIADGYEIKWPYDGSS